MPPPEDPYMIFGDLPEKQAGKKIRGAPSTVRKFITCSDCSMEGALPKKERVPTVLRVAQF